MATVGHSWSKLLDHSRPHSVIAGHHHSRSRATTTTITSGLEEELEAQQEAGAVGPVDRTTTFPPWLDEDPSAEGTEGRSILVSWL